MYIFTEREIRDCVSLNLDVVSVIEQAFAAIADERVTTPPIMRVDIPEHDGEVDVKSAYVKGESNFAIKISSGFFKNHLRGLPTGSGMMVLISTETGIPQAVLLDNGYLTDVRTAAAGAVAAKHLAPASVKVAGVIGTGSQARYQSLALQLVRSYEKLVVYGRNGGRVQNFIADMESKLGVPVVAADSADEVLLQSQVVVTTTPSCTPVVHADALHAGLHITAMGSDAEHKQELDPEILKQADLLVCDLETQCLRLGELHHAVEEGILTSHEQVQELGQLTSGRHPGRTSAEQLTVCDLTGTGVQDTAIAQYALARLLERGYGTRTE